MKYESIALFCGSSEGKEPIYLQAAQEFGRVCAQKGITLYYGGAALGLMKAAADTSREAGGRVVGITPHFFSNQSVVDQTVQDMRVVESMSERKQEFEKLADAFVILPGGYGTLDELFEILTDAQLGLHQKPIVVLNTNGYYNHLIQLLNHFNQEGFLRDFHRQLVIFVDQVDEIFIQLEQYQNSNDPHWLKKIKNE